ncbi:hypothetical protein ACFL5B_02845 [Candidatus Latescibacterota bacterium]
MSNNILTDSVPMLTRRQVLAMPAGLALALPGVTGMAAERPKIAAIITEYRQGSHAHVIANRLLEGYWYNNEHREPSLRIVSMYTDQVPDNDMSRDLAAQYKYEIFPTIRQTLNMGGNELAVDGVVLIGEHGDYPVSEKEQHMYPRYELFKQIVEVFRETGKAVPVFCDKHISYDWDKAKWMYDQSRELNFPFMAGSNLPMWWREPELEFEIGTPIEYAVSTYQGAWRTAKDDYGFHALEILQCMVERRNGGETGIAAVQCLEGPAVWKWTDANPWAKQLIEFSAERSPRYTPGNLSEQVEDPIVFILEYRNGLKAAVYRMNGVRVNWSFAAKEGGREEPVFVQFRSQPGEIMAAHFTGLVYFIEKMIVEGRAHYPVERTLLTSGALAGMFDSTYQNGRIVQEGRRLETPQLHITYSPQKESLFNRFGPPPGKQERR